MTVGAIVRKAGPYNYSSGASYPFYFKVFAASDVVVTKTDVIGSEETLTYSDDYTVSINNDQDSTPGGSVSLVTSFTTSYKITISSAVPATQETVITNQGGFYPDTLNKAFDKLTILCQQSSEELSRCVKVNISSGENPKTLIDSIHTDSLAAIQSAASASTSESAAAESETAAATSEANAAASATAALASQNAASESETNAAASATSASNTLTQMQAAYTGIDAINTAVTGASASASAAGTSETNAATSEANAAASETAAETSAASALTSRNEAAASQIAAATSEANAAISETSASQSAAQAALSAEQAAAGQVNTDWNATSGKAQIFNKPVLSAVASSGQYDDLSGKPDLSVYATNTSVTNGLAGKSDSGHVHSFAALTDKPDTLAGYGVAVDAVPTEGSANPVTSDGVKTAIDAKDALPAQAGNADKFLKTDGTQASWESVVMTTVTYWS